MDKLTVINDALAATGNSALSVLNDGSDESQVAERAFDRAVRDLVSRHNWPFARVVTDLTEAAEDENPSSAYGHAFKLPTSVFHVAAVRVQGVRVVAYEIIGRYVCLDYATDVTIEGYAQPADASWHPQAAEIITLYVEAGCLSGLNEDFATAAQRKQEAELRLLTAAPRVTRQNPARNVHVSSIDRARRGRIGTVPPAAPAVTPTVPIAPGSVLLDD